MVGKERYLKQFKDFKGRQPKLKDKVLVASSRGYVEYYVTGIHVKYADLPENNHVPRIKLSAKYEFNKSYNDVSPRYFSTSCTILDHNEEIIWQSKK